MTRQASHSEFLQKLSERNQSRGDIVELSPTSPQYSNNTTKLLFSCPSCNHEWWAKPFNVVTGRQSGCPKCKRVNDSKRMTTGWDDALTRMLAKHGELNFEYDQTTYKSLYDPMRIKCPTHGWQNLTPKQHIKLTHGCPECYQCPTKYTLEGYAEKASKVFGGRYKYVKLEVVDSILRITSICPDHGEFTQQARLHIRGHGCISCARSRSFIAETWLQHIDSTLGRKCSREWRIPNTRYTADGYDELTNTIYEFHGDYHHGNTDELLEKTNSRTDQLQQLGYTVVEMWESQWRALSKELGVDIETRIAELRTMGAMGGRTHPVPDTSYLKLTLKDPAFLGYKHKHVWTCDMCGSDYTATLTSRIQTHKKHGSVGCATCARTGAALTRPLYQKDNLVVLSHKSYARLSDIEARAFTKSFKDANPDARIFFEDEWLNNRELIERKMVHIEGTAVAEKLYARNLRIDIPSQADLDQFLNANHIQGSVSNQKIRYGLYHTDQLVACMTFTPPRRGLGNTRAYESGTYELVRYATDASYRVVGGASKLLAAFVKHYSPKLIYSFADKRWSDGNMYYRLGFSLESTSPSDYFYVKDGKRYHRWGFRRDAMKVKWPTTFDPDKTERENALAHGYHRVWGLGQLKFIYTPNTR